MTRCTFKQGQYSCGSYAFNLWKEGIEQGEYCDRHYWQDQVTKARADEREACAKAFEAEADTWTAWPQAGAAKRKGAAAIRARGTHD